MKETKKMQSFRFKREQLDFLRKVALIFECTQTELVEEAIDYYLKDLLKYAAY